MNLSCNLTQNFSFSPQSSKEGSRTKDVRTILLPNNRCDDQRHEHVDVRRSNRIQSVVRSRKSRTFGSNECRCNNRCTQQHSIQPDALQFFNELGRWKCSKRGGGSDGDGGGHEESHRGGKSKLFQWFKIVKCLCQSILTIHCLPNSMPRNTRTKALQR